MFGQPGVAKLLDLGKPFEIRLAVRILAAERLHQVGDGASQGCKVELAGHLSRLLDPQGTVIKLADFVHVGGVFRTLLEDFRSLTRSEGEPFLARVGEASSG